MEGPTTRYLPPIRRHCIARCVRERQDILGASAEETHGGRHGMITSVPHIVNPGGNSLVLFGATTVSHSVALRLLRCARNDTREMWFSERQRECHCAEMKDSPRTETQHPASLGGVPRYSGRLRPRRGDAAPSHSTLQSCSGTLLLELDASDLFELGAAKTRLGQLDTREVRTFNH